MNTININSSLNNKFIEKTNENSKNNSNPLDLQKNFLSLLIAQIKNQDPTDPIKNTELTSQLAQINTASGIERLNNTVGTFSSRINNSQNIQVSSLIGRRIMVVNDKIVHNQGSKTRFGIELISNTTSVTVQIKDDKGTVVYLQQVDKLPAGTYNLLWDGKDLDGHDVITGKYNVVVTAMNKDKHVPANSLSEALVNSIITSSDSDPIIDIGVLGITKLSNVREILQ